MYAAQHRVGGADQHAVVLRTHLEQHDEGLQSWWRCASNAALPPIPRHAGLRHHATSVAPSPHPWFEPRRRRAAHALRNPGRLSLSPDGDAATRAQACTYALLPCAPRISHHSLLVLGPSWNGTHRHRSWWRCCGGTRCTPPCARSTCWSGRTRSSIATSRGCHGTRGTAATSSSLKQGSGNPTPNPTPPYRKPYPRPRPRPRPRPSSNPSPSPSPIPSPSPSPIPNLSLTLT